MLKWLKETMKRLSVSNQVLLIGCMAGEIGLRNSNHFQIPAINALASVNYADF